MAQGFLMQDNARLIAELQKQNKVRLYLVSGTQRLLAEVDKPEEVKAAIEKLRKVEPTGGQSKLGDGVREVLTELRGVPPRRRSSCSATGRPLTASPLRRRLSWRPRRASRFTR